MKYVLAFYFWLMFLPTTVSFFIFAFFAHLIEKTKPAWRTLLVHKVACSWGRTLFFLFPVWRFRLEGKEHMPKTGDGFVVVANHQSAGDIFTMFCTGMQFRWLSKAEVFKIPLIGPAMRWGGYVPVQRGNSRSHQHAMTQSKVWLKNGVSMLFFPEGTRSKTGQVAAFKSGAFRLAEDAQAAILPVAMSGTHRMLQKIWPMPSKIVVKVFPPMRRNSDENLDQFTERVRQLIIANAHA